MTTNFEFPRHAACHPDNGYAGDLDVFFPVGEPGNALYDADVERAQDICAACPVRTECLVDALDAGHEFGVFGGMDAPERLALIGTPRETLLRRHAEVARERENARVRALARPIDPVGRAAHVKGTRPRGRCSGCGYVAYIRIKAGTMCPHTDRHGRPCEGLPPAPSTLEHACP